MVQRGHLLVGVSVAVLAATGFAASAQTTQDSSAISTSRSGNPDRANSTQVQEVVVTGSRIAHTNLDQPTPISTLSPQQIEDAGTANLGDIIAQLPEVGTDFGIRANSNNFGGTAGISAIDLHNLGVNRTLVLVDGQRHVSGDISTDGRRHQLHPHRPGRPRGGAHGRRFGDLRLGRRVGRGQHHLEEELRGDGRRGRRRRLRQRLRSEVQRLWHLRPQLPGQQGEHHGFRVLEPRGKHPGEGPALRPQLRQHNEPQ